MRVVGLSTLRIYRQSGVATRLAVGSSVLLLLVLATALASLSLGPVNIPVDHVASIILSFLGLDFATFGRTEQLVIEQIRLPRILVGALVGMALGVAGATMQGLFRNPMADPGIIGISAGGAVGAVVAIASGMASLFFLALPTFAFVGAVGASFLVYGIAAVGGRFSMATLLLAGVAVNAFLGAIVSAIIILLPDNGALREILFWLAGGLDSRSWEHVRIAAPLILGGTAVIVVMARDLNLLTLGDDEARSMGVRVGLTRVSLLTAAALATGAAVAVSGTICLRWPRHAPHSSLGPWPRPPSPDSHERPWGCCVRRACRYGCQDHNPARRVSCRCPHGVCRGALFHFSTHQEQPTGLLIVRYGN